MSNSKKLCASCNYSDEDFKNPLKCMAVIGTAILTSFWALLFRNKMDDLTLAITKSLPAIFLSMIIPNITPFKKQINFALKFCAFGDFCLQMEHHPKVGSEFWFLGGLVSFLIGHIFFSFGLTFRLK